MNKLADNDQAAKDAAMYGHDVGECHSAASNHTDEIQAAQDARTAHRADSVALSGNRATDGDI